MESKIQNRTSVRACAALYLRRPEVGASAPKHVAVKKLMYSF